jgi:site-specific DNA-methyltransferase (adenine-specific)
MANKKKTDTSGVAPTNPPTLARASGSEKVGRPSSLLDTRVVYCGDNLEQLAKLPDSCVDLIYIDPPFNSNRNYEVFWGETKEKRSFEDRHASTQAYIEYMRPRCVQLARVLKGTGSFYYHCDWHASHYVKVMLDQIFGENNFQNEIIWKRHYAHNDPDGWGRVHDTIFFYVGTEDHTWNTVLEEYDPKYVEEKYRFQDARGSYRLVVLTAPGTTDGDSCKPWRGIDPREKGRHWSVPQEHLLSLVSAGEAARLTIQQQLDLLDKHDFIYWPKKGKGVPEFKKYLGKGVPIQSVITDIPPVNSQALERLGYPTQKPLPLLERIIRASSNANDIVLDAFCGCGTALVAAQNLGRQWIGIDISPTACRVMAKRLRDVCNMKESEPRWKAHQTDAFVVRDLPWTVEKLRALPPFEFENWAVIALGGIPNKVQVGDMGVDGRIFPVGTKPSSAGLFSDDWFPIQVKQMDKVGRPDIDAFEAVMEREGEGGRQRGFFVSFGYTKDAELECAAYYKRTGRIIKLLTVKEILDEEHVQKM